MIEPMSNAENYRALASTDLKNHRSSRYDGGGFSVSLNDMVPEDVSLILRLYQSLKGIYDLWLYMGETPNYQLLRTNLKQFCTIEFIMAARAIGVATYTLDNPPPELRKAFHDIRGGALSSLASYAKLIPRLPEDDNLVRKAVFLARDHAKMMRKLLNYCGRIAIADSNICSGCQCSDSVCDYSKLYANKRSLVARMCR